VDWIGIAGLDHSWVPPACYKEKAINDPNKPRRSLVINIPSICLDGSQMTDAYEDDKIQLIRLLAIAEENRTEAEDQRIQKLQESIERYESTLKLLKWLRNTCMSKLVIPNTDGLLQMSQEAGWSPEELVLKIGSMENIMKISGYYIDDGSKVHYPKRYDCRLMFIHGVYYRVPGEYQVKDDDTPETKKAKYAEINRLEEEAINNRVSNSFARASEDEIRKCASSLLNYFMEYIYTELWHESEVKPFYALYFDEPKYHFGRDTDAFEVPGFRATLQGFYDAIRAGRENTDPLFYTDRYQTYFGIGWFDSYKEDMADVLQYGDFVFDTKYDSDAYFEIDYILDSNEFFGFHHGSQYQSQNWIYWREDEPEIAKKMRGSWVHLMDDVPELDILVETALNLGWKDLYVFPAPDVGFWDVNYRNDDWRNACKRFRDEVLKFCKAINQTDWLEDYVQRYNYLYCKHYPDCKKCDKNNPEDWVSTRPQGFPNIDRSPAKYLSGFDPDSFMLGTRNYVGESDG